MMAWGLARIGGAALVATLALGTACGGDDAPETPRTVGLLETDGLPAEMLGLSVRDEDVSSTLEGLERSYLDAATLYSLREGELLQATLQIARFNDDARLDDEEFRLGVVNRIGSIAPKPLRVGEKTVYLTAGSRQRLALWFEGDHLFVLAIRDDYPTPRALIREALEVTL